MWLKHFPNLSRTSRIGKRMSELSMDMEKNISNPRKWRESHEGWVGNKRTQFRSQLALPYPQKSKIKQNKEESVVKRCLLILDVHKVAEINPKLEIKHSWGIDGMC